MVLNFMYILRVTKTLLADLPHNITQRGNRRESVFFKDEDTIFYLNWLKELRKIKGCAPCNLKLSSESFPFHRAEAYLYPFIEGSGDASQHAE